MVKEARAIDQQELCAELPFASFAAMGKRFSFNISNKAYHGQLEKEEQITEGCEKHVLTVRADPSEREFDEDDLKIVYRRFLEMTGEDGSNPEVRVVFMGKAKRIPTDEDLAREAYQGTGSCKDC